MPTIDSNARWFSRAVYVLPIIVVGLGVGGAIGGFAGFAIDNTLTVPPRQDIADATSRHGAAATTAPVRPIQAVPLATALANTVPATMSAATPATPSQAPTIPTVPTPTVQSRLAPWPDALTRSQPAAPVAAQAAPPSPALAAAAVTPNAQANDATRPAAPDAALEPRAVAAPDVKAVPAKRLSRQVRPNNTVAATAARIAPVYDYYGNGADAASQSGRPTAPDAYRRRSGPSARYNGETHHGVATATRVPRQFQDSAALPEGRQSAVPAMPPQPPPIGGLFGGGNRYDGR